MQYPSSAPSACITSVDAFLLHPLAVKLGEDTERNVLSWECCTVVPDGSSFKLVRKPSSVHETESPIDIVPAIAKWLKRHKMTVHASCHAVLDLPSKLVYPVDLVCERDACLHQVFIYYTKRKCAKMWATMAEFAKRVEAVTVENYGVSPTPVVINIYGQGSVRGCIL
jgi:hypothetical protein